MEKLELKHIAPYFAYGLKCEILNYKCDYVGEKYGIINGYYFYAGEPHYTFKTREESGKRGDLIKPILRPLSDLIKEIEIDGKKFIPLVEIAKTALCDTTKIVGPSKTKTDYGVMFDVENDEDSFKHEVFAYSHEIKMFGRHYRTYPHYEHTSQILFVPNQLELFEKLYEWHFDIHGLIDSGLAVDINTLSE